MNDDQFNSIIQNVFDPALKSQVIEDAYLSGYSGCFLTDHGGPEGQAALDAKDRFKASAGVNDYKFTMRTTRGAEELAPRNGVEGCHIYTADAFEEFEKYNEGYPDWLFSMFQDSGCCVGAAGTEMNHDLLGKLSRNPNNNYKMVCLAAMWIYLYRNHCGGGWYMGAHASEAIQHGWCPATIFDGRKLGDILVPDYKTLQFDNEDESERLTTRTWCRGRPPEEIERWCHDNFMFNQGAITELDDRSANALMAIAKIGGDLHHGSNYTAGSGGMNSVRRIGGHAQTDYGSDWSDQALEFFSDRGVKCSKSNFIKLQGQTWGNGWSGTMKDSDWPFGTNDRGYIYTWADILNARHSRAMLSDMLSEVKEAAGWGWGPKPEGSWIVNVDKFQRYFAPECYVYLPDMQGVPLGSVPPPPPPPSDEWPQVTGDMFAVNNQYGGISIRGGQVFIEVDGKQWPFLAAPIPDMPGRFRLVPKIL